RLTFQFSNEAGVLIDTYTLYASPGSVVPPAPSNVAPMASGTGQLTLNWSDNSSNEDLFKIERSTDGANFTQIATVSVNANTYLDSGLTPGVRYFYRVRANNNAGDSAYSNVGS